METRFPSMSRNGVAYLVRTEYEYTTHGDGLSRHFREYATYNDGMTQHGFATSISKYNAGDALASLAAWIMAEVDAGHMTDVIQRMGAFVYEFDVPNIIDIEKAYMLKYKEGKPQWFERSTMKASTNAAKEHDKRWERLPEFYNGTPQSAYHAVVSAYADEIKRMVTYEEIKRHSSRVTGSYQGDSLPRFFGVEPEGGYGDTTNLSSGLQCAMAAVACVTAAKSAVRFLESARYNLVDRHKVADVAPDAVAA